MHCGCRNIDLASACHKQMPDYTSRPKTVAAYPVASATFFHDETPQAVFNSLIRLGTGNDDGGALGEVQANVGMIEWQFRPKFHARLLVWVYGYNSREKLRDDLGTSLKTLSSSRDVIVMSHPFVPE